MLNNGQEIFLKADEGDAGKSLKAFILRRIAWFPYKNISQILLHYEFSLKGKTACLETVLNEGEPVDIFRKPWQEPPVPLDLMVLFEDRHLLVVDKPAGLPVLPTGDFLEHTLLRILRETCGNELISPLHRLDMETSGVLLLAKSREVRRWYQTQFQQRQVLKTYEALAHGHWPQARRVIDLALVRDTLIYSKFVAGSAGKEARTEILETMWVADYSFITLKPITGKTHQLRAHLAACGHPLVGDKKYHTDPSVFFQWLAHRDWERLREKLRLPHHALHCRTLGCQHVNGSWRQWRSRRPVWQSWVAGVMADSTP